MLSKIWRLTHLTLSILSCVFLVLASVTGIILGVDEAYKQINMQHRVINASEISLAQSIPGLRKSFMEISTISMDKNDRLSIVALDDEGNQVVGYVQPETGTLVGPVVEDSPFIQQVIAFHRSLFLKDAGRIMVGISSFLLLLLALTGLALLLKRQQGIRKFFSKIKNDFRSQFLHVYFGRLLLIPIIIIALSGTYLSLLRFDLLQEAPRTEHFNVADENSDGELMALENYPFFKETKLSDIKKVEFPFDADPAEYFIVAMKDKIIHVSQVTGTAIHVEWTSKWNGSLEEWSVLLHTGQSNWVWAIVLSLTCLGILLFIYTGFRIAWKRLGKKVNNTVRPEDATVVILVGTENGTTTEFGARLAAQFASNGHNALVQKMNDYTLYPKAEHLVVLTATYGEGEAPDSATSFIKKLKSLPQAQTIQCSVVAFGSTAYDDFCAFGIAVDTALEACAWTSMILPVYKVNDRSLEEFTLWVNDWGQKVGISLVTSPAYYQQNLKGLQKFEVLNIDKSESFGNTFLIRFKNNKAVTSGDLFAIYPDDNHIERLYSIALVDGTIQLVVKLHEFGKGSNYLFNLTAGMVIKARIIANHQFHMPDKSTPLLMIGNGTGIAPFLGMINENSEHSIRLIMGFRAATGLTEYYQQYLNAAVEKGTLTAYDFTYSRQTPKRYVMDALREQKDTVIELLEDNGSILICGSKAMQQDVEAILNEWIEQQFNQPISYYKERKKIKTDCY